MGSSSVTGWEESGRSHPPRTALNLSQLSWSRASDLAFHRNPWPGRRSEPYGKEKSCRSIPYRGSPVYGLFSNNSSERRGTNPEDAVQLPSQRMHPLHSQSPAAATEGSCRRAAPGHSGHRPAEVTLADRPSAGRYQLSMGRIKIQVRLAAAGIVRLGRPEGNKYLDHGCESRMGG